MRTVLAGVLLLILTLAAPSAWTQKASETDGNADVLNGLMLKASDRCYGMTGAERSACCQRYFDNLCDGGEIAANAPPAPIPAPSPAAAPAPSSSASAAARNLGGGDGPASALNGFVLKEVAQCRPLPAADRRACCERLLHPNACVE